MRVALALSLGPRGEASAAEPPGVDEIVTALGAVESELERANLSSPTLCDSSALIAPAELPLLLDDGTLAALGGALLDDAPGGGFTLRDPGLIHQELLETGLLRLGAPSVRFSPAGAWVSSRDVLAQPSAIRSKWLQRTLDLPKSAVQRYAASLASAGTENDIVQALTARAGPRVWMAEAGALVVTGSGSRRRTGSHYTPPALRRAVVERTLAPLVNGARSDGIRSLRICDPAMGSGDFLVEAARFLAAHLARAASREGGLRALAPESDDPELVALRIVVAECIYGVDKDPVAVDLARWSLSRLAATPSAAPPDLSTHLKWGDALVGETSRDATSPSQCRTDKQTSLGPDFDRERERPEAFGPGFDWQTEFPEALSPARGGFDACVGNPPWVAYAGRAAQPLDPALARYYERNNPAFHGYRTLHGLFVRRAAELLRPGGRLGLVLPTSVADLAGYAKTRAAHDALCDADTDLLDFGDGAFDAVFQPCMALTSTRRVSAPPEPPLGTPWKLSRTDLDAVGLQLLERLSALPTLSATLFGERGFQTTGDDLSHLRKLEAPEDPFTVAIREGTDIAEFERHAPRTFLNPRGLVGRFRALEDFQKVEILIRQTARYPIAALSDGVPFRNSILAGFSNAEWPATALVAYLNSSAVRWYHYTRYRDARQGMPQLKIGHLRAVPTLDDAGARAQLREIGTRFGERNCGVSESEREELDGIVFAALGLSEAERELVLRFFRANPPPVRRVAARPHRG